MNVPDTKENRNKCLCPGCPSYPFHCRGERLYCSTGGTSCRVEAKGCICPDCLVYSKFELETLYFCDKEPAGKEEIIMRKPDTREDPDFYQTVYGIKAVAETGTSVIRAMGSRKKTRFSLDDIHLIPAQVYKIPKNREEPVNTEVIIGPSAKRPLKASTPVIISGMSFGAVSKNIKIIISQVAARDGVLFNSGEGGVLGEDLKAKKRLIVQYSTGRYGITEDILKQAAAVEIRFGQGAYPGKGSLLPAAKITSEIAALRGLGEGEDSYSPAHHQDMKTADEIREKIEWLRKITGGVPVGAKIGCGAIEQDISVLVGAGVDFIAIDGFGGGTGATAGYVRENVGLPLVVALPRASRYLERSGVRKRITLIAGGNLRTSADFVKCLALGADAVYIGTAALIAINCEQYRICHTGRCPTGVTTQKPGLVRQCNIEKGTKRLSNFIKVMTDEIANLTRIVGKQDIHDLDTGDLVAFPRDLSRLTGCQWLDGEVPGNHD